MAIKKNRIEGGVWCEKKTTAVYDGKIKHCNSFLLYQSKLQKKMDRYCVCQEAEASCVLHS